MVAFLVACLVLASVIIAAQHKRAEMARVENNMRFVMHGPITSREMPWLQ